MQGFCRRVSLYWCHFRSANLILNLFSLMLDAGVPDIALEPDKTVQKVFTQVNIAPALHFPL